MEGSIEKEYEEFIRVTRRHQAEREKQKKLALKKPELDTDEYYIDISQVNTVVEDNLVECPDRKDVNFCRLKAEQKQLVDFYGGQEAYERIRSMEMSVDDYFKRKCQDTSPFYWPVIPIDPKPYLNPLRN